MENEIKKLFQISGYLLRSFANGLDGIARHIESLTQPSSYPESASETPSPNEPDQAPQAADARKPSVHIKPSSPQSKTEGVTKTDIIMGIIANAEDGVGVDAIARETGFDKNTIRSAASRLRKQGKVKSKKQGVYMAA